MTEQSLITLIDIDASLGEISSPTLKVDVKQAIEWALEAWSNISAECISHCWQKTGILPL